MNSNEAGRTIARFPQTSKMFGGGSRTTIRRWEERGLFPKRVRLSNGAVGWFLDELQAHQAKLARGFVGAEPVRKKKL